MAVSALSLTFKFIVASPHVDSQSTYHRAEIHAHFSSGSQWYDRRWIQPVVVYKMGIHFQNSKLFAGFEKLDVNLSICVWLVSCLSLWTAEPPFILAEQSTRLCVASVRAQKTCVFWSIYNSLWACQFWMKLTMSSKGLSKKKSSACVWCTINHSLQNAPDEQQKTVLRINLYRKERTERTDWKNLHYGPVSSMCRVSCQSLQLSVKQNRGKEQVNLKFED